MTPFTIPPSNKAAGQLGFITDIDNAYAALSSLAGGNVLNSAYAGGAAADGVTDDQPAIQAALNLGEAYLPPGTYGIKSPLSVPDAGLLRGKRAGVFHERGTVIKALPGFTGTSMINFPAGANGHKIESLCLDATAITAGSVTGILPDAAGNAEVQLTDLFLTGAGIQNGVGNVQGATSWRAEHVTVSAVSGYGFGIGSAMDSTWLDCYTLSSGVDGWWIFGCGNSHFIGCRAEWSGGNGFYLNGAWPTGTGSGGPVFTGCGTDRNARHGVYVDATGTTPVTFSGLRTRRDGSSGTYAGLDVAAGASIIPVLVDGWQCFPGVNDDGTGSNTPSYGLSLAGAVPYVAVTNAFLHAATTAANGMTTANGANWRAVATRTGTTAAPTAITLVTDSA